MWDKLGSLPKILWSLKLRSIQVKAMVGSFSFLPHKIKWIVLVRCSTKIMLTFFPKHLVKWKWKCPDSLTPRLTWSRMWVISSHIGTNACIANSSNVDLNESPHVRPLVVPNAKFYDFFIGEVPNIGDIKLLLKITRPGIPGRVFRVGPS